MNNYITIAAFIADVKQILAEDQASNTGLERIAELMHGLVRSPIVETVHEDLAGNVHTGRQSKPLYNDESGLTLVRARFGPEALTPIHSHGSWGVVGVYRGRDRYQSWRRLDTGTGAGSAQVEMIEERIMEPGDVAILPPPPQDIHAQQGYNGETAYEFVLFGKNTMLLPRLYFDHAQGVAREVVLGKA